MLKKIFLAILAYLGTRANPDTPAGTSAQLLSDALELVTPIKPVQKIIAGYYLSDKWQEVSRPIEHVHWYMPLLHKEHELSFFQSQLDVITAHKPIQILITQYLGASFGSSPASLSDEVTWDFLGSDQSSPKRLKKEAKFYLTLDPFLQAMNSEHTAEYRDGDENISVSTNTSTTCQLIPVGDRKLLCALNFSPDGCYLVAATHDNTIKIWERPALTTQLL